MKTQQEIDNHLESLVSMHKPRGLVYGKGDYDVKFPSQMDVNGRRKAHSAYRVWRAMLQRCYGRRSEVHARAYGECDVCPEWWSFSGFLQFWNENYKSGYHLDKDLLYHGNNTYSPTRCVFVPQALNKFTTNHAHKRGLYPQGVCFNKYLGKFSGQISIHGRNRHIGTFATSNHAHSAWHNKKLELASEWKSVCDEIHPRLFAGLMSKVRMMREKKSNN